MAERIDGGRVAPGRQPVHIDSSHPEVQALHAAGIHPDRVAQLAQHHGVEHPSTTTTGTIPGKAKRGKEKVDPSLAEVKKVDPQLYATDEKLKSEVKAASKKDKAIPPAVKAEEQQYIDKPKSPSDFAKDILIAMGVPDTPTNQALLERQMQQEGMPGSENNPLATTLPEKGSWAVNSAGVQSYPSAQEGISADAATLQGMPSLAAALKSGNATPEQYAQALTASNYEGLGGASNPANVAYGQAFLGESPATSFGGSPTTVGGNLNLDPVAVAQAQQAAGGVLDQAASQNAFSGLNNVIPQLGTQGANNSLQQALAGLASNQGTLTANTTNAPGSPDQPASESQQTTTPTAAQYQQLLAQLLPNIKPGAAK